LYSDETHLSNDGRVKGKPIYIIVVNISLAERRKPKRRKLLGLHPIANYLSTNFDFRLKKPKK
jgi:hypothetical protein